LAAAILLVLLLPLFFYKKIEDDIIITCNVNNNNKTIKRGTGFFVVENILDDPSRENIVSKFLQEARNNKNLNEDKKLEFYSNEKFLKDLSGIVGEKLYPVNSLDLQRCWLRYYFQGMKAQYYENYHHDIKRYGSSIKQYRMIIPVFDTSDAKFTIDGHDEFRFKQNMGVFLEADNCLHKVKFNNGERLLLIMDFITKDCDSLSGHYKCRNVSGYSNWVKDVIWRNVSSVYYKFANS
jgi:hypothetical protein